jgi:hypothetical protein
MLTYLVLFFTSPVPIITPVTWWFILRLRIRAQDYTSDNRRRYNGFLIVAIFRLISSRVYVCNQSACSSQSISKEASSILCLSEACLFDYVAVFTLTGTSESLGSNGAKYNENLPPDSFSSFGEGHTNVISLLSPAATIPLASDLALYGPL